MSPARVFLAAGVLAVVVPFLAQLIRTDAGPGVRPRARRTP